MVVDSLLLKLHGIGYTVQAYTDDLEIVIRNKQISTVADLMQGGLRVVNNWCKAKGLYKLEEYRSSTPPEREKLKGL